MRTTNFSGLAGHDPNDSVTFINEIQRQVDRGFGFVPFIGAGFSAPSGVPLISELEVYLQRCLCIALGLEEGSKVQSWNPRTDRWPPLVPPGKRQKAKHWEDRLFKEISTLRSRRKPDGTFDKDDDWAKLVLYSEAFGAMQDWRSMLQFVSRLQRKHRDRLPALTAPDKSVIDAFFRQVLGGRYPTLGHRMLGVLAGGLRIDVILTTNFDDLLERAFSTARNPLQQFEITPGSMLPPWSAIGSQRAIVKLHGGRMGLRADYSLDEELSDEEKDHYLTYFVTARSDEVVESADDKPPQIDRHLIVMGCGAKEERVFGLINHAVKSLGSDFRVFWICYSDKDYKQLTERLNKAEDIKKHFVVLRHSQPGLLLLQLYQQIRKTLPPLGSIFPSSARLTLPPFESPGILKQLRDEVVKNYEGHFQDLKGFLDSDSEANDNIVFVSALEGSPGVTTLCANAYRHAESAPNVIPLWIDMNNVSSSDNLFEVLLEAIYYRLGVEDWIPSTIGNTKVKEPEYNKRGHEIERLLRSANKSWVIFLNARETPGANTLLDAAKKPWIDEKKATQEDESACSRSFLKLVERIALMKDLVKVVVLYRTRGEQRPLYNDPGWQASLRNPILITAERPSSDFDPENVAKSCLRWSNGFDDLVKPACKRFLYALVALQRPRFPAILQSEAVNPTGISPSQVNNWMDALVERRLVRMRDGGMIWIHSQARSVLRSHLEIELGSSKLHHPSQVHRRIGEWYEKVIDASDSPDAVFEAADHFCKSAEWHWYAVIDGENVGAMKRKIDFESFESHSKKCADMLRAAAAVIQTNTYLIQTHSYSRGSCRRLEQIAHLYKHRDNDQEGWTEGVDGLDSAARDLFRFVAAEDENHTWLLQSENEDFLDALTRRRSSLSKAGSELVDRIDSARKNLWMVCVEAMRAIAREVGEDKTAFRRHRILTYLECGESYDRAVKNAEKPRAIVKFGADDPPRPESLVERLRICDDYRIKLRTKGGWGSDICRVLRWSRWSAMLCISSRSYAVAEDILWRFVSDDADGEAKTRQNFGDNIDHRIEYARIVEQAAELRLLQIALLVRCAQVEGVDIDHAKVLKLIRSAHHLVDRGQRIATSIRDHSPASDGRGVSIANWCEVRLLLHKNALQLQRRALGLAGAEETRGYLLGTLSDAEAKLRISDPQRTRSELALIDLYRAEERIVNAAKTGITITEDPGVSKVGQLIDASRFFRLLATNNSDAERLKEAIGRVAESIMDRGNALQADISDAIRFLDRSELILRDRRRNVWWTAWYFDRKLRVIGLSVLVSCGYKASPIPFLGLEAAMRQTPTEPQELLRAAIRMIRVDAYRLTTIIESYFGCILALLLRLACDESPRLPLRLEGMLTDLERGLNSLMIVRQVRRVDIDRSQWPDAAVDQYINRVADNVSNSLRSKTFGTSLMLSCGKSNEEEMSHYQSLIDRIVEQCKLIASNTSEID